MPMLTCGEMVAGCLAGRDSAWKHFVTVYIPFAAALFDRHCLGPRLRKEEFLGEMLRQAREQDARFFREYQGQSEREFLLHLRGHALRGAGQAEPEPEIILDWQVFEGALQALTALERQIVWLHLLGPQTDDADKLLRLSPETVKGVMHKAQEALRQASQRWNQEMLFANRRSLTPAARSRRTEDCVEAKVFLRLVDGQISWRDRLDLERHLTLCWRCVDELCRFREVIHLARQLRPLSPVETESYLRLYA